MAGEQEIRRLPHIYVTDDVLPAEHVQDWCDFSEEILAWAEVEHDRAGAHRTSIVPVASAIIGYDASVRYQHAYNVQASKGFESIRVHKNGVRWSLFFVLPGWIEDPAARFLPEWSFTAASDLDVTASTPLRLPVGSSREHEILLGEEPVYHPTSTGTAAYCRGGALVILGRYRGNRGNKQA